MLTPSNSVHYYTVHSTKHRGTFLFMNLHTGKERIQGSNKVNVRTACFWEKDKEVHY